MISIEFLLTSLIVVLIPGTGVLYTLSIGLSRGWIASIYAAFGCTLGIVPHIAATVVGVSAVMHMSATAFSVVKILGVLYLLYLAWGMWNDKGVLQLSDSNKRESYLQVVVSGILLNILNPKLSLFFLAFMPQFIPASTQSVTANMLWLASIFMLMTFAVFVVYGGFASAARQYVISKPAILQWLRRGFSVAFVALGAKLALAER